jgi:hypothetical protein
MKTNMLILALLILAIVGVFFYFKHGFTTAPRPERSDYYLQVAAQERHRADSLQRLARDALRCADENAKIADSLSLIISNLKTKNQANETAFRKNRITMDTATIANVLFSIERSLLTE